LQALLPGRHSGKDGVAAPRRRQLDFADADFGRALRPASASKRIGEQLMAQADAEERALHLSHPLADGCFFSDEPWMLVDVPHVHGPPHHPQRVIFCELGDFFAFVELDRIPCDPVLFQKFAKNSRVLAGKVLEDEKPHR
jgi:hypothetical protein